MHGIALLGFLPVALGCLNTKTNPCASYIKSNVASASAFCATFTQSTVTATTALPAWATNCDNKPKLLSSECSCHYTGGGGGSPPGPTPTTIVTTTRTTTAGGSNPPPPTGITTTLPQSSGAVSSSAAILVPVSLDGGMKLYDRSPSVCAGQKETVEADAMFILEPGATLSNVIIGPGQAEGVHCRGPCTLINVWWQDVCEDALTIKQSSGTSYVIGGGAFKADDKIFQFNGFGTLDIKNFYAEDYGKVVRSCGNCSGNGGARHIVMNNVLARNGGVLCGINTNYGDTCTVSNSCQDKNKICDKYTGNNTGKEPKKISSGPDDQYCIVSGFTTSCAA